IYLKFSLHILLLLLPLSSNNLLAQNDLLRVRNFGIEDGLSQRDIYKVLQDSEGFLWVATKNGLDRYDGHQFIQWYTGKEKTIPNGILYDFIIGKDNKI